MKNWKFAREEKGKSCFLNSQLHQCPAGINLSGCVACVFETFSPSTTWLLLTLLQRAHALTYCQHALLSAFQNHLDSATAKSLKALKTSSSLKSNSSKKHLSIPPLSLDDTPISSAPFTSKITSLSKNPQHSLKTHLISSRICTWLGLYNPTALYCHLFQVVLSLRDALFSHCS